MSFEELLQSREAVITRTDAASAVKCDPRLISRGCRENKIPHITLGRRIFILREPFIALFMGSDWSSKNGF